MNAFIDTVISSLPVSDTKLKEIVGAQEDDKVCERVKKLGLVASLIQFKYTKYFRDDFANPSWLDW